MDGEGSAAPPLRRLGGEDTVGQAKGSALVLEGGGYRGAFTAGALDVLMERGVWGFESIWGTSAGSLNAVSFRSRQIGRSIRVMLAFRDDRRLTSLVSLAKTGDITGEDFLYHEVQEEIDPCDTETFNASATRMFCVATDMVFGTARYFELHKLPDDIEMVRASSAVPIVSHSVEIAGHRYLDGGTADSVAFDAALGEIHPEDVVDYVPAERALVVLTQHREYVKGPQLEGLAVLTRRYQRYPLYVEALATRSERYMAQRERLWELEREGRVLVIVPEEPVTVAPAEHAGAPLLDLYLKGRRQVKERFDEILEFLK